MVATTDAVAGEMSLVLDGDAERARDHHRVHHGLEAALLDVLLVSVHPAVDVGRHRHHAHNLLSQGQRRKVAERSRRPNEERAVC